jgi:hypothetical protein
MKDESAVDDLRQFTLERAQRGSARRVEELAGEQGLVVRAMRGRRRLVMHDRERGQP